MDSYRIGKQVGVTLPVYPMRGNLVTIPINVGNLSEKTNNWDIFVLSETMIEYTNR